MSINSDISERFLKMIDYLKVNPNSFAIKLGYNRSQSIYDILNGKSAPSYDFFNRFLYSEYSVIISIDWLITGRGNILNEVERPPGVVMEGNRHYETPCQMCHAKNELIDSLREQIETQKKLISILGKDKRYKSPDEDGQKRKAV